MFFGPGLMPDAFSRLRESAGLTIAGAADYLKVDKRTIYRYENGETHPSRPAVELLMKAARRALPEVEAPPAFRFIDLFAGIGGLRLGFESIGGRCVFTSEWDAWSQKTYTANFRDNHVIAGEWRGVLSWRWWARS